MSAEECPTQAAQTGAVHSSQDSRLYGWAPTPSPSPAAAPAALTAQPAASGVTGEAYPPAACSAGEGLGWAWLGWAGLVSYTCLQTHFNLSLSDSLLLFFLVFLSLHLSLSPSISL